MWERDIIIVWAHIPYQWLEKKGCRRVSGVSLTSITHKKELCEGSWFSFFVCVIIPVIRQDTPSPLTYVSYGSDVSLSYRMNY